MTALDSVSPREGVTGALLALDDILTKRGESAVRTSIGVLLGRLHTHGIKPLLAEAERRDLRGAALGLPDRFVSGSDRTSLERFVDMLLAPDTCEGPYADLVAHLQGIEGMEDDLLHLYERASAPDSGPYAPEDHPATEHLDVTVLRPEADPELPPAAWTVRLALEGKAGDDATGHDDTVRKLAGITRRWRSVTPATNRASDGAAEPVRTLLLQLGMDEEPTGDPKPRLAAQGLLPPSRVDDPTVALPAALRLLSRTLAAPELPHPAPGMWAAGGLSPSHLGAATPFESLKPGEAPVRADACGGTLVHPGHGGWFRTSAGDATPTLAVADPGLTLAGAARAYWGAAWDDWTRDWHTSALKAARWRLDDWTRTQPDGQWLPDVRTDQVDSLVAIFHDAERKVAVLGGPSGSGKSCIVRCTARALAEAGRRVVVLSPDDHAFPSGDVLARVVRHALGSLGPQEQPGTGSPVVILDDIRPIGETDVDRVLRAVSAELGVGVLACLGYDINSLHDWQAANLAVVPSIVRPAALLDLAARARAIHGDGVAANPRFLDALVRRFPHDLSRFVKGLCDYRGGNDRPERLEEELRQDFTDRLGLGADTQDLAAAVAAVSLLGGNVSVPEDKRSALGELGAASDRDPDRLRFPSPTDSRTILDAYAGVVYPDEATRPRRHELVAELVAKELFKDLGDHRGGLLPMLRGARLYDERVCRSLADRLLRPEHEADFAKWRRNASPVDVALVLLAMDSSFGDKLMGKLLDTFVARLREATLESGRDLLAVIRAIHKHRHRFSDSRFDTLAAWMAERFGDLLDDSPKPDDGLYSVLEQLSLFHHQDLDEIVARRGAETLIRLDPDKALDYRTVGRVERLVRRAANDIGILDYASFVQNETEVRKLLDHDPDPARGIALYISSLVLRLRYDPDYEDWETVFRGHQVAIRQALRQADAVDLRYALVDARDYRVGFVTKMLNDKEINKGEGFGVAIRNALRTATPTDAALLIRTTSEIHDYTARHALYGDQAERPDVVLARSLAQQVRASQDLKGAGLLLSATARVDELFLTEKKGFGQYLAEEIGKEWVTDRLEDDPRISIQYHLIKGIWETHASFREECLDQFVDVVAGALNRSLRPWGPQAALLLGQDEEFGADFLVKLRRKVVDKRLFEGMREASITDARRFFHQLGRAMFQGLSSQYVNEYDAAAFVGKTAAVSPAAAALSARETARTLVDGGVPRRDAGLWVLRKDGTEPPDAVGRRWAAQISRGAGANQLTEVMNVLAALNRETAAAALDDLETRTVPRRGRRDSQLREKARQAVYSHPADAARLLTAVERVSAGVGVALMRDLQSERGAWNAFTSELAHIQHPTQQYEVVRQLVALGLRPGGVHSNWVDKLRDRHQATVLQVTSPAALCDVLRLALIWDVGWAARLAADVPGQRLARRLAYGRVKDLMHLPSLLSLLVRADAYEPVRLLLDELERLPAASLVKRLNAFSVDVLLDVVIRVRPDYARRLAPAVAGAVDTQIRREVVLDEAKHWNEIGWMAHSLHLIKQDGLLSRRVPKRSPNPAYPHATAWGAMWLPRQDWTRDILGGVADRVVRPTVSGGQEVFVAYAYASAEGRTAELRSPDGSWPRLGRCSARKIAALQRMAERDPALRSALVSQRVQLMAELDKPVSQVDAYAKSAREWFTRGIRPARRA
ncbi:AAA family ATPase [Streptomyces hydrogenans]|uniref:AAA family ATPase n=1 Tax=Streptomyces hydrogenans TaxID=1873719 RepID=UPI00331CAA8A